METQKDGSILKTVASLIFAPIGFVIALPIMILILVFAGFVKLMDKASIPDPALDQGTLRSGGVISLEDNPQIGHRSPERALAHVMQASAAIQQLKRLDSIDTRAASEALLVSADQSISAIEADWLCGDGYIVLAVAYHSLSAGLFHSSDTISKECAILAVSVIVRWAKLRERHSFLLTSPAGVTLATEKFGELLSGLSPDQLRTQESLEAETYAIDRQHVLDLKEKLLKIVFSED